MRRASFPLVIGTCLALLGTFSAWADERQTAASDTIGLAERKVTLHSDKISIQAAVQEVCRQAGFTYDWRRSDRNTQPDCRRYIRIHVDSVPAECALEQTIVQNGLKYQVDGRSVWLERAEAQPVEKNNAKVAVKDQEGATITEKDEERPRPREPAPPVARQEEEKPAPDEKWAGFRGLKWGTSIADAPGMVFLPEIIESNNPDARSYRREGDKLAIGEAELGSITYGFYKGRLYIVWILANGGRNSVALQRAIEARYGPGRGPKRSIHRSDSTVSEDDVWNWDGSYLATNDASVYLCFTHYVAGRDAGCLTSALTFSYVPILRENIADDKRILLERQAAEDKMRRERAKEAGKDF